MVARGSERVDRPYRLARRRPRLGRLLSNLDQVSCEFETLRARPTDDASAGWYQAATSQLELARAAAAGRRIDDGWTLLLGARQLAINVYTAEEIRAAAAALWQECDSKLCDWRRLSAQAQLCRVNELVGGIGQQATREADRESRRPLPEPTPGLVRDARAQLMATQRLLNDASQHTYLRLRLLGQRLMAAACCLTVVLTLLGVLAWRGALGGDRFSNDRILADGQSYLTVVLLGVLGALLSFAIGTINGSGSRRIYELATARFAALGARLMVGAAAAVVLCLTIQSGVVNLGQGVTAILAITAGFSERLVRRILESLSDSAERPPEPVARAVTGSAGSVEPATGGYPAAGRLDQLGPRLAPPAAPA
jgi:hypothetical protein